MSDARPRGENRYVAYYRVSTDRQGRSGLGLQAQQEAVRQYLIGRPADVVAEYVEVESGANNDRPKLKEAIAACRREKAVLLIAKLDRLARSVSFIANLMDSATDFVAVDMPHASRLVLHVMAAFAEHERDVIRERTRAALAAAKARGVRLGINGTVLAARNKAEAAAYAEQLRAAVDAAVQSGSRTTREIAKYLNALGVASRQGGRWHPASVARVVSRLRQRESRSHTGVSATASASIAVTTSA
jgi:DNA invertase Pin-like site-specific DNA recombinase